VQGFDLSDFVGAFFDEARERLVAIEGRLVRFEQGKLPEEELVALRRDAHTIKGSALMLGLKDIGEAAHVFEDAMQHLIDHPEHRNPSFVNFLFELHDALSKRMADGAEGAAIEVDAWRARLERLIRGEEDQQAPAQERKPEEEAPTAAPLIGAEEVQARKTEELEEEPSELLDALQQEIAGKTEQVAFASEEEAKPLPPKEAEEAEGTEENPYRPNVDAVRMQARAVRRTSGRFLRVDAERVEALANRLIELTMQKERGEDLMRQAEAAMAALDAAERRLQMLPRAGGDEAWAQAFDAIDAARRRWRAVLDAIEIEQQRTGLMLDELRDEVMRLMLRPLDTVFAMFPRAVREVASKEGKKVRLVVAGESVEIERSVAEALGEPLVHLINNAIVHGIEPPEERKALGKPEEGQVSIIASQHGNEIRIEVIDDGRGIDVEKIKQVAIERGVTTAAEAEAMDRTELLELIFRPGFSTREGAGTFAGRGIGLNAVQSVIRRHTGVIRIETEVGKGTRFIISLPVSVAVQRALVFRIGDQKFAMLAHMVDHVSPFSPEMALQDEKGRAAIRYGKALAPLIDLRGLIAPKSEREGGYLIFAEHIEDYVGIVADELLGEPEIVVRELDPYLKRYELPGVMGVTLLPDGDVVFLLEPNGLKEMGRTSPDVRLREEAERAEAKQAEQARGLRVLLAEDSLIAREVEKRMLEAAGFAVEVAIDGQDALDKLKLFKPDVIITDIEMPRLDGFGLVQRVRNMPELSSVPIMVISTRESAEDRMRALDAGADAYLVKQQLTSEQLRRTIDELLQTAARSTAG